MRKGLVERLGVVDVNRSAVESSGLPAVDLWQYLP